MFCFGTPIVEMITMADNKWIRTQRLVLDDHFDC